MKKDIDYYMSLPYEVRVEELSEDDGGGIFLSIPLLGWGAVNGHGDTYPEARQALEDCKRDLFEIWLDAGADIPEPEPKKDYEELYSEFEKLLQAV